VAPRAFNGLIQHSFALRNHIKRRPFRGTDLEGLVRERFAPRRSPFRLRPVGERDEEQVNSGSPLFNQELTTLDPKKTTKYFRWHGGFEKKPQLPNALLWANREGDEEEKEREGHWERSIFAKADENGRFARNDLLVAKQDEDPGRDVSELLCEVLAARRSMLFGLALANRFVNVMLPHAVLAPEPGAGASQSQDLGSWLLQPMVSLIRVGNDGGAFRRMYTLTFFLLPVTDPDCRERTMRQTPEMEKMVNAGWGLASWPSNLPTFTVDGPLPEYLSHLTPADPRHEAPSLQPQDPPTLRHVIEAIAFGVALRMAEGSSGRANLRVRQEIGNEVVSALGNSRVSSVLVVDERFRRKKLDESPSGGSRALASLMNTLSGEVRIPPPGSNAERRRYRLDRPYIDHDDYAIGVLPSNRCLVIASDGDAQHGRHDSGLMQAGWATYSVIGAVSAIGTMRAINRDLESADRTDPTKIAEIEHDVSVDLHEIYDLDITWEAYRLRYRRLREQLGITSDYQALHGKLDALFRETSACFEAQTQRRLVLLTAAIVLLTAAVIVVTIIVK